MMTCGHLVKFMSVDMYKQLTQDSATMGHGSDLPGLYDLLQNHYTTMELSEPILLQFL